VGQDSNYPAAGGIAALAYGLNILAQRLLALVF
jgi:hypothetical protein